MEEKRYISCFLKCSLKVSLRLIPSSWSLSACAPSLTLDPPHLVFFSFQSQSMGATLSWWMIITSVCMRVSAMPGLEFDSSGVSAGPGPVRSRV